MNRRMPEAEVLRARFASPASARESLKEMSQAVRGWVHEMEQTIAAYPGASLALATAAGVILGWWVKRK